MAVWLDGFPGTAALYVEDINRAKGVHIHADEVFPAASLIKLFILWEFFRQVENGRISPTHRITLTTPHKVGGAGILPLLTDGLQPTLLDLARLMMIVSDNTATNLLIDQLDMATINHTIRQMGCQHTILQRKMMDFEQAQAGFENHTTARETAELLKSLLTSPHLSPASRKTMLEILKQQLYNDRLSAEWPETAVFAHKTGNLPGVEHDAGILLLPERPIILVLLSKNSPDPLAGAQLCRKIGRNLADQNWTW